MVCAVTVDGQGAAEIGSGKGGDIGFNTHFLGGSEKGRHRVADIALQRGQGASLVGVRVKTAEADEEYLPAGAQLVAHRDRARHRAQLPTQLTGGELGS